MQEKMERLEIINMKKVFIKLNENCELNKISEFKDTKIIFLSYDTKIIVVDELSGEVKVY